MASRWHVSKQGKPAICRAKGICPLGGEETHFTSEGKAYNYIAALGEKQNGLLPKHKSQWRKAKTPEDLKYVRDRIKELSENQSWTYISRCRRSKRLFNYRVKNNHTDHFASDRQDKMKALVEEFGEGQLVGHYEVNHIVRVRGRESYKTQIIEIRDNGRMTIYDRRNGNTVTTFMAHDSRIEGMMLMAGDIPEDDFLKASARNRIRAQDLSLS